MTNFPSNFSRGQAPLVLSEDREPLAQKVNELSDGFLRAVGFKRPLTLAEEWRRKFCIPDKVSEMPLLLFTLHKSRREYLLDGVQKPKSKYKGARIELFDSLNECKSDVLFETEFIGMRALDLRQTSLEEIYDVMKSMAQASDNLNEGREMEYYFDVLVTLNKTTEDLKDMPGNYFFNVHTVPALNDEGQTIEPNPTSLGAVIITRCIPQYSDREGFEQSFQNLREELVKSGYFPAGPALPSPAIES